MHGITQDAYSTLNAVSDAKTGPVVALEGEIGNLSMVAAEVERIADNISGNGPPRDANQKLSNVPVPVLSISQRIGGAAGQIAALRERIGNAMIRIEQSL